MFRPAIIVQARLESTRFPGKVMADINGKPMLHRILERLKKSRFIPTIIVATANEGIARYCAVHDLAAHYIADEREKEDVLLRMTNAAHFYQVNPIVRVTADCPLLDIDLIDRMFMEVKPGYDYISNVIRRSFPYGTDAEIIPKDVLFWLNRNTEELRHREHVTLWIRENFDKVSALSVENEEDYSYYDWRVDYPDDLEIIQQIYKSCGPFATWQQVLEYMGEHVRDAITVRRATGDDIPADAIRSGSPEAGPVSEKPSWYERGPHEKASRQESNGKSS